MYINLVACILDIEYFFLKKIEYANLLHVNCTIY